MLRRSLKYVLLFLASLACLTAQEAAFPLESVAIEGSALSKQTILEIAHFRLGAPVDKAAIDAGCKKLEESGLFESINYRYAPGPNRGYALTLTLTDQSNLSEAAIDIPGINEDELWKWLAARYPAFDRKVPSVPTAQDFLARQIAQHLATNGSAPSIVARLEQEFAPRPRSLVSFQPENLPRIASMNFVGQHELNAAQLERIMQKVAGDQGYFDRRFRQFVELNLRPAYEEHGMYRVRFPAITIQKLDTSSVAVQTTIEEGPKFNLGEVRILGDGLPLQDMQKTAAFKHGDVANWTEIQQAIWEMEKPLKRQGYLDVRSSPERLLHDDTRVLDLTVTIVKGPMYRLGQVRFTGLAPDLEAKARKLWKDAPGQPFDYACANDFLQAFSKVVDFRQFKRFDSQMQPGPGDHVMDLTILFEPR
jgi:outer membrane protein assembly factor BamA